MRIVYKKPRTKPYGSAPFVVYLPINISPLIDRGENSIAIIKPTRGTAVVSLVAPQSVDTVRLKSLPGAAHTPGCS